MMTHAHTALRTEQDEFIIPTKQVPGTSTGVLTIHYTGTGVDTTCTVVQYYQ